MQISHLSDDRLLALTNHTKQFQVGTLHRARVIGHSPMDGIVLLSFEQKVLDQVFMQVDELKVGQVLKVCPPIYDQKCELTRPGKDPSIDRQEFIRRYFRISRWCRLPTTLCRYAAQAPRTSIQSRWCRSMSNPHCRTSTISSRLDPQEEFDRFGNVYPRHP